jgi:hypothetical protein
MCIPAIDLEAMSVEDVALLGLDQSLFDWYSQKSAGHVLGFIGANVLRSCRVEVDLPRQMTYWRRVPSIEPRDLDIVGLTLRPEGDRERDHGRRGGHAPRRAGRSSLAPHRAGGRADQGRSEGRAAPVSGQGQARAAPG